MPPARKPKILPEPKITLELTIEEARIIANFLRVEDEEIKADGKINTNNALEVKVMRAIIDAES